MLITSKLIFSRRLRSFLGYPPVRDAIPNTSHYAIAALQYTGHISRLITQNVDGLHTKAIKSLWTPGKIEKRILELHGTLHVCNSSTFITMHTGFDLILFISQPVLSVMILVLCSSYAT